MATLTNRIEKLKNCTSDVEVRQLCESMLELTDHVPEKNLSILLRKRLKSLDSQDAHTQRFMLNEKRLARLSDMGISRALDRIKMTGVWIHNPQIQYILEWYEKNQVMKTPDYLIAEQFINQMKPFCYDPTINEAIGVIRELQSVLEEDIIVAKTINILENSRASKFYAPLVDNLKEYLENKSIASRSVLISESETYAYEPVVRELQNALKAYDMKQNKHKLNIQGGSADCTVDNVYSFVLVERNADYFAVDGHFFKKVGNNITVISEDAMSRINSKFVELNSILNEEQVFVDRNRLVYSYGKNTIAISTVDKSIKYNGNPLRITEVNDQLLEAGIFKWEQRGDLNKVNALFEHIDALCEIDFAKKISAKMHRGVSATLLKLDDGVTIVKTNPHMNENKVYSGINGNQAKNIILEFLGYDISHSLVEFISEENKALQRIENDRRDILNRIDECEKNIRKIDEAQSNDMLLSNSEELTAIKRELNFEINSLKDAYSEKTNQISSLKTYEEKGIFDYPVDMGNNFEDDLKGSKKGKGVTSYVQTAPSRDFSVGDEVDVADRGIGRITGIDSAQKSATVIFADGSQSKVEFPDMRKASDVEVEDEDDYQEELGQYADAKKKGTTSYVQQPASRDFSIGEVVTVIGKGLGKITAIDSIRHVAIVFLQNGQQTEEEFSNLQSEENNLDDQLDTNTELGFDMSGDRDDSIDNQFEQPFESIAVNDVADSSILDIDDDVDSVNIDNSIQDEDAERASKFASIPGGFKAYLDQEDAYHYNPEDVAGKNFDPEYKPEESKPELFMDADEYSLNPDEVSAKEVPDLENIDDKLSNLRKLRYSVTAQDAAVVSEEDDDFIIAGEEAAVPANELEVVESKVIKLNAIVSPSFDGPLSDTDVLVSQQAYESASLDDVLEVEVDGKLDFVPKSQLIIRPTID